MGGDSGRLRKEIEARLLSSGAVAVGFAEAGRVSAQAAACFDDWLAAGRNAGMAYMANHKEIRVDPRLLLDGEARTLVCVRSQALPPDYHMWVREAVRRSGVGQLLGEDGRDWRICVDSAPVMERYWAVASGIAVRGANGAAIIPG